MRVLLTVILVAAMLLGCDADDTNKNQLAAGNGNQPDAGGGGGNGNQPDAGGGGGSGNGNQPDAGSGGGSGNGNQADSGSGGGNGNQPDASGGGGNGNQPDSGNTGKGCIFSTGNGNAVPTIGCTTGQVTIKARKTYNPSAWKNGFVNFTSPTTLALPKTVPVTEGNSGNHWITLCYRKKGAQAFSCRYRGGSDQAHPAGAVQIAKGNKYTFLWCDSGAVAGQSVVADQLSLHLDNGDSFLPATSVEMTLGCAP
jgi:hypothetical protein